VPVFKRPHFGKLLSLADQGRIAPFYFFVGDPVLSEELIARLLKRFSELGHEISTLDSPVEKENPAVLFGSPSLLGRRIFHLKGLEKLSVEAAKTLVSFLERSKSWLTICGAVSECKENHPLYLYALEKGVLVPLPSQRKRDLLAYEIPEILASFGKKMDRAVGEELLALVGEDLNALRQELTKLALYVGKRATITREDLYEIVTPHVESAPYSIVEAYLRGGPEETLNVLEDLLGRGVHPLVILSTLITYFKRLYLLAELSQQAPQILKPAKYFQFQPLYKEALKKAFPEKIPKNLARLHPYAAFKMLPLFKRIPFSGFKDIFSALTNLDYKLKRGAPPREEFYAFLLFLSRLEANSPAQKVPSGSPATFP